MCLAIPMKLAEVREDSGVVEMGGIRRRVNLSLVENPRVGDYVIVHAGFAISIMDQEAAEETLQLVREWIEKDQGKQDA